MDHPLSLTASEVPPRPRASRYPPHFAARVAGRERRALGDPFGLTNFGVNLTIIESGSESALMHRHARQDEFVYILEGHPILATNEGEVQLKPGDCAGFPAGGIAHHLINRTDRNVVYLEIGDRTAGDTVVYPSDDLAAHLDAGQRWIFTHSDGTPW